VLLIS